MQYFGFEDDFFPPIQPVFSSHGHLSPRIASQLQLKAGIPISYKAGDQPNNALSLNVMRPGEVAAVAGTSGVIYGISDQLIYDPESKINTFAHVNYTPTEPHLGALLCINGTGSINRWTKNLFGEQIGYSRMNDLAANVPIGCDGLRVLPFGNGAERMLGNKQVGVHFHHIGLNIHQNGHIFRAVQEGIACAFRYGLDIMKENGIAPKIIRAGRSNLFLSPVFIEAFVNMTGIPVELYENNGSVGAGIGSGVFKSSVEAFEDIVRLKIIYPTSTAYDSVYQEWHTLLSHQLKLSNC